MTELDHRWATLQIEALADGSLSPDAERRMRDLIQRDPDLARQLERAIMLRRELRQLVHGPVPKGLARRLWSIPAAGRPRSGFWLPALAAAGIGALALTLGLLLYRPGPSPEELAGQAAAADFAIVVAYLQKSVLVARDEVNKTIGTEMVDALTISSRAMSRTDESKQRAGQND
jgi:anti-sigma factor RsiW